jgi:hypothetical protein
MYVWVSQRPQQNIDCLVDRQVIQNDVDRSTKPRIGNHIHECHEVGTGSPGVVAGKRLTSGGFKGTNGSSISASAENGFDMRTLLIPAWCHTNCSGFRSDFKDTQRGGPGRLHQSW